MEQPQPLYLNDLENQLQPELYQVGRHCCLCACETGEYLCQHCSFEQKWERYRWGLYSLGGVTVGGCLFIFDPLMSGCLGVLTSISLTSLLELFK